METESRSWVLKRNCALTPRQLLGAFFLVGASTTAVSLAWAWSGAWVVIPFMLLEWVALTLAFLVYSRHATDHETVTLESDLVRVEVVRGSQHDWHELPREWLRCQIDETKKGLVRLVSQKREVAVGQFVSQIGRERFLKEFKAALSG